jgi:glycoprotein-N-acetylgalactosamine 3-beta-galactosyltransferase
MVYTHSNRHDVLKYITQTYATQCDGFFAASNRTDPTIGAWALPHPGPESYENMWNKVQHMWLYVYQHFIMDFDLFHIGGDDMYVIPDNLRRLAASQYEYDSSQQQQQQKKPQPPMYLGASIPNSKNPKRRYCGGGAGYTLNRRAVAVLVQRFRSGECPAVMASDEDVRIGRCLEDAGIKCQDTNDRPPQMEVRYHHLDAQFHSAWIPSRPALWLWEKLQYFHNIRGNQTQLAQISNTTTTFHLDKGIVRSYSRDRGIRRYHAILYQYCGTEFQKQVERAAICNKEEQKRLRQKWEQVPKAAAKKE